MQLFLCGDVMTGRGIDQIMRHSADAALHEPAMHSARDYVRLAEKRSGPIPRAVSFSYIWGDALNELQRISPDVRLVNLETAITRSDEWLPKGINYRMHPANMGCLHAAQIDICTLANNHVLDWGSEGLWETVSTLREADIQTAGAGVDLEDARSPAIVPIAAKGRVLVFAGGHISSGIAPDWAATPARSGVNFLADLTSRTVKAIAEQITSTRQPHDVVVYSIHWGGNWGYAVPQEQQQFAHALIDEAHVDIVHGHSSHHPKSIEVYRDKLIFYGCGDLINDYEGISEYDNFRSDVRVMYFPTLDAQRRLRSLIMIPLIARCFSLHKAMRTDAEWLREQLAREGEKVHTGVSRNADNSLQLHW